MQTFAPPKPLVDDPGFARARQEALAGLDLTAVDRPIRGLIRDLAELPHCFSQQCCWGHFVHPGQPQEHGIEPLAGYDHHTRVLYRIAYVALCVENSTAGRALLDDLAGLAAADPDFIQYGSADWFWDSRVNTYQVQVEPLRHQFLDSMEVGIKEALRLEKARGRFFVDLAAIVARQRA